jgi:hypothetical protein
MRVAGSEPLKISTPIKPLIQPLVLSSVHHTPSFRCLIGGGSWRPETVNTV